MVRYGYGLNVLESISQFTGDPYRITFYTASCPELVGINLSHGATYYEARTFMKESLPNQLMGLDLILEDSNNGAINCEKR